MSQETPSVDAQQLASEQAIAESDEAKRAAEKRAAALGVKAKKDAPDDAKPKSRKQTTR